MDSAWPSSRRISVRFSAPTATNARWNHRGQSVGIEAAHGGCGARSFSRVHAPVTGQGESFKAGGYVVKNVTGYDLPKLLAGSWGTLAVLTEVTVRVVPAPELDRTLVVAAGSAGECLDLLTAALRSAHDVSAAAVDPERGSLLRLEGFAASVEARTRALVPSCAAPRRRCSRAPRRASVGTRSRARRRSRRAPWFGGSRYRRPMRCACSSASTRSGICSIGAAGSYLRPTPVSTRRTCAVR